MIYTRFGSNSSLKNRLENQYRSNFSNSYSVGCYIFRINIDQFRFACKYPKPAKIFRISCLFFYIKKKPKFNIPKNSLKHKFKRHHTYTTIIWNVYSTVGKATFYTHIGRFLFFNATPCMFYNKNDPPDFSTKNVIQQHCGY